MWAVIIVILVVVMLVGPIMMMQPSKSQKRLAALRQEAVTLGLHVNSSTLKETDGGSCWFYWLALPEKSTMAPLFLARKPYAHGLHVAQFWAIESGVVDSRFQPALEACLGALPESVLGLGIDAKALGVHWTESGGQDVLVALNSELHQLQKALSE
ncbi:MAG: hypothetical protein U5M23_05550 [Marinagarivorans sp.]|nr:hypothetical protein [Marinagarivorans sp.]